MIFLGAGLGDGCGNFPVENKVKAAYKAFYSLQNPGLHFKDVNHYKVAHIFNVGMRTY